MPAKNKPVAGEKPKSLRQKIIHLLRKRAHRIEGTTVIQIAHSLRIPRELAAKTIFLLFSAGKLEIYHQYVELKKKKPRK
ncbi:MAG: hypothetical protein Q8L01_02060 [Candidatus Woesebacteria bacterium]|nr:hypothetical protein [Candidatus Woesebacteria bacterium]